MKNWCYGLVLLVVIGFVSALNAPNHEWLQRRKAQAQPRLANIASGLASRRLIGMSKIEVREKFGMPDSFLSGDPEVFTYRALYTDQPIKYVQIVLENGRVTKVWLSERTDFDEKDYQNWKRWKNTPVLPNVAAGPIKTNVSRTQGHNANGLRK